MPRAALEPGTCSEEISAFPYTRTAGQGLRRAVDRKHATLYVARGVYRRPDGSYLQVKREGKSSAEAVRKVKEVLNDLTHAAAIPGDGVRTLRPSMRFVDAGKVWFDDEKRRNRLSKRSMIDYQGAWDRYVDTVGSTLRPLTLTQANRPVTLAAFLQDLADTHGEGAARTTRTVLSNVFKYLVRMGIVDSNGARATGAIKAAKVKRSKRDTRRAPTREDFALAMRKADERAARPGVNPRTTRKWGTVADVLAFVSGTAVRITEARLLLWTDVDLDAGTVLVAGTKTHSARRHLYLPEWLVARLRRRADLHGSTGHVFSVTLLNGSTGPLDQSNLAASMRELLDEAELTWATPHSLRRGVATLLNESGHSLKDIAGQLGHTDPSFTARVYISANLEGDKSHLAASLGQLVPEGKTVEKTVDDQEGVSG